MKKKAKEESSNDTLQGSEEIVDPKHIVVDMKKKKDSDDESIKGAEKVSEVSEDRNEKTDKTMHDMCRNFMADDTQIPKNKTNVINKKSKKLDYRTTPYNDGMMH